jgi:hypothetical protein
MKDQKQKNFRAKLTQVTEREVTTQTIEMPIIEGYVDLKLPQRHKFNNGNFVTVFQKAILNISQFANLTKNELILFLYLIGSVNIDNSVCIDLNILSDELNIAKPNVSNALAGLVRRNIVIRKNGYRYGKNPMPMELVINYDQLNFNVAYNGKTRDYQITKGKHPELTHADGRILQAPIEQVHRQKTIEEVIQEFENAKNTSDESI